ncbi:MAG: hypothetical protein L3J65_03025 [Robiginitomaculum sp.]|nr:hypothetical protein [Robiginitomaculum sp.]
MFYADTIGAKAVYERIQQFAKTGPYARQDVPLLKKRAETGGAFKDVGG